MTYLSSILPWSLELIAYCLKQLKPLIWQWQFMNVCYQGKHAYIGYIVLAGRRSLHSNICRHAPQRDLTFGVWILRALFYQQITVCLTEIRQQNSSWETLLRGTSVKRVNRHIKKTNADVARLGNINLTKTCQRLLHSNMMNNLMSLINEFFHGSIISLCFPMTVWQYMVMYRACPEIKFHLGLFCVQPSAQTMWLCL